MTISMLAVLIVIPCFMVYLQQKWTSFHHSLNILAVIAATSITQIILEDAVFMTTIHAVFLHPIFLITGAYLGLDVIYQLINFTIQERVRP
ncbi:transposase [Lysinibacillus irui]|uniref:Transposase n=1 Tax=Lysinibacillus irui TaxID=2998077 RepID=A0AAJ5RNN7_9BACI|nr:transposase [Lysinibacillus irui]WDV08648.1 transposase [Lysinibacillus irui]